MRRGLPGLLILALAFSVLSASAQSGSDITPEAVSFDEAVRRAIDRNYTVAQAAQAILSAEAFLKEARTIFRPALSSTVTTTILDSSRGFDEFVTQPQTQTLFGASLDYPILAASRWAAAAQAGDQIKVARLSVDETRRQIAIATAQAYLAVITQHRLVEANERARANAQAHLDDATARLQSGAGSRLNQVRAAQELATYEALLEESRLAVRRAQEALVVLMAAATL